jgi:hypothetical protein
LRKKGLVNYSNGFYTAVYKYLIINDSCFNVFNKILHLLGETERAGDPRRETGSQIRR